MYVVITKQLLNGVELPSRDGIVKLQDSAELWWRVGDDHSHDGSWEQNTSLMSGVEIQP